MRAYASRNIAAKCSARYKMSQAMRTEGVKVVGSRWNRPCVLEAACEVGMPCICNMPAVVRLRSRDCSRVACGFLKWCRAIPASAEQAPLWREQWAFALMRCPGLRATSRKDWLFT